MSNLARWRDKFPYSKPREIQELSMDILFREWNNYDVFVIQAPTAYGKTGVAKTITNIFHAASVITPTNLLVDQFLEEFPDTPTLKRLDSYMCCTWDRPCSVTRAKLGNFCKGGECKCSQDLARAKYRKGPGIYNYHIYQAHQLFRPVLVVDEAHNLIKYLQSRAATKLWRHDYKYPSNMYSTEQMSRWVKSLECSELGRRQLKHKKIRQLDNALHSVKPEFIAERGEEEFNGKGTERGKPEMRDCIRLLPVDVRDVAETLWPQGKVSKTVLMSATINHHDIDTLGLNRRGRRVLYLSCESPIEFERRPIYLDPITSVTRFNMSDSVDMLAGYIDNIASSRHVGEKGIIHVTYQMSEMLRPKLTGDRYLFHGRDPEDKREKYREFRESDPRDGRILVACGMYEGIDLPEDLGRFQVVAKVPWLSLASPAIRYQMESNPSLYDWETLRVLIQACGRICRTPEDYGVTYIPDMTVFKLLDRSLGLCPEWWVDGLVDLREIHV